MFFLKDDSMLSTTGLMGVEIRIRYVSEVGVLFCGDYITLVKIGRAKAVDRPYNNARGSCWSA